MVLNDFRSQVIEWDKATGGIYESISASKGDSNGRKLIVHVLNEREEEDLTGSVLSLAWHLKENQGLDAFVPIDETKGIFEIYYTTGMLSNIGTLTASLVLVTPTGRIESKPFKIFVQESVVDDTAVQSQNSFTTLTQAIVQFAEWGSRFEAVEQDYKDRAAALETTYAPRLISAEQDITTNHQEVTAQLAQNREETQETKQKMNTEVIPRKNQKPIMTFIDDDGRTDFPLKWKEIIEEKNIPTSIAVITGSVGNYDGYLTWDELKDLRDNYGVELLNHTHTHKYTGTLTDEEIYSEFKNSTEILKQHGGHPEIMVYPYGSQSRSVRRIGREFFRAAFDIRDEINYPPLETYRIRRVRLADSGYNTIDEYKERIDECVANNGWLVWMSHSHYPSFDDTQIEYIKEIIDYARSKGVEIVSASEGLDLYGNIIDVGDYPDRDSGADYTVMGVDGVIRSTSNSIDYRGLGTRHEVGYNTPINEFEPHKTTVVSILGSHADVTKFPERTAGTLETYRGAPLTLSYQLYNINNSNKVYRRHWNGSNWSEFDPIMTQTEFKDQEGHVIINTLDSYSADTTINDFPNGKIITFAVSYDGGSGFPDNSAGVVTTYRVHKSNWNKQEFRKYRSNEVWSRWADGSGVWQPWVKISVV